MSTPMERADLLAAISKVSDAVGSQTIIGGQSRDRLLELLGVVEERVSTPPSDPESRAKAVAWYAGWDCGSANSVASEHGYHVDEDGYHVDEEQTRRESNPFDPEGWWAS